MAKQEIATTSNGEALPAELAAMLLDEGEQFQSQMGQDDLARPFIKVLQTNSPACDEEDPRYVEGAKAGMLLSTMNSKVYPGKDAGFEFIPCAFESNYIEWNTKDDGGGIVEIHPEDTPLKRDIVWTKVGDSTKPMLPNGKLLVHTHSQYILYRPAGSDGPFEFGILTCSGTKLKHSKRMNSLISAERVNGRKMPRFLRKWTVTTWREQEGDQSWWNVDFKDGPINSDKEVYEAAKNVFNLQAEDTYKEILKNEGDEPAPDPVRADAETGEIIDMDDIEEIPFS